MKRKIVFAQKPGSFGIRGLAGLHDRAIFVGKPCPGDQGGGIIADMELAGGNAIAVRKVDADGKPVRNWGQCPLTTKNGQANVTLEGDGALVPLAMLEVAIFVDVPDVQPAKQPDIEQTAKPIPAQPKGGK